MLEYAASVERATVFGHALEGELGRRVLEVQVHARHGSKIRVG